MEYVLESVYWCGLRTERLEIIPGKIYQQNERVEMLERMFVISMLRSTKGEET